MRQRRTKYCVQGKSDASWFLLIKTLLIKNNKKREAALKNEAAGGDEKRVFFLLGLMSFIEALVLFKLRIWLFRYAYVLCRRESSKS